MVVQEDAARYCGEGWEDTRPGEHSTSAPRSAATPGCCVNLAGEALRGWGFSHRRGDREAERDRGDRSRCLSISARSSEYDLITAFDVLEHIEDDHAAAAELSRVLRPGGRALIAVPCDMALWSPHDEAVGHVRRYNGSRLEELMTKAGFVVDRLWSWNVTAAGCLDPSSVRERKRPERNIRFDQRGAYPRGDRRRTLSTGAVPARCVLDGSRASSARRVRTAMGTAEETRPTVSNPAWCTSHLEPMVLAAGPRDLGPAAVRRLYCARRGPRASTLTAHRTRCRHGTCCTGTYCCAAGP